MIPLLLPLPAMVAQPPRFGPSPELQAKTQADHKHLLELLKIEKLRPGPSGTPTAPNAAIRMASCADTTTTFGGLIALQNLINASKRRWTVSNDNHDATARANRPDRGRQSIVTGSVKIGVRFVEDDEEWVAEESASQRHALTLPA